MGQASGVGACVVVIYAYFGIAILAAICWLIGYIIHLRFGRFVLKETKDAASLRHAAGFTRSYRSANFKSISDAIAKLGRKGRTPIELCQAVRQPREHAPKPAPWESTLRPRCTTVQATHLDPMPLTVS